MSRSYRKSVEISKDSYGRYKKYAKKAANRRVRRTSNIPSGKAYKKVLCSWEICDYRGWWSISEDLRCAKKWYFQALEEEKAGERISKYEKRILKKGLPTYEKVYKERRRYER